MMTAAIIDDLEEDRNVLKQHILRCTKEGNVQLNTEEFCSSEQFLQKFIPGTYHIIFIDIFLKKDTYEADGMELAKKIRALDQLCIIIFSTTSPDFAIEGYKVRAGGYLLKPYGYKEVNELYHILERTKENKNSFIEVKEKSTWQKIRTEDIIYVTYYNHYSYIYTKKDISKTYLKFSKIEEMLKPYSYFLCCNRGVIVNMNEVQRIEEEDFLMSNEERIPIKKRDKKIIVQQYSTYIFNRIEKG